MKSPRLIFTFIITSFITACGGSTTSDNSGLLSMDQNNGQSAANTQATPSPSASPMVDRTPIPTITATPSPLQTPSPQPTPIPQPTMAPEPSVEPQETVLPEATNSPVSTPTNTPAPTFAPQPTISASPTVEPTPIATATPTPIPVESNNSGILQKEAELTNTPEMAAVKSAISTRENSVVAQIYAGNPSNPENVKRVESIISISDWEFLFPERSPEYTYENFLKAIGKFQAFCGTYTDGRDSDAICRKALATMFAHFTQETGGHTAHWDVPEWRQGLVHVREMGWNEDMRGGYNGECNPSVWQGQTWPCGTFANGDFKSYFGRGAKQLSYNYNYGPFSEAMFGNVRVLLDNPELVADTWLNIASAVFFFVYPQPPKPAMLHAIDDTWQPNTRDIGNGLTPGFGVTTQIINGGVECGGSVEIAQSLNRINYYQNFAQHLGVPIPESEVLGCAGMQQFDAQGSGALNIYWEQDWSWVAGNPNGESFACKLVGYQTPFSAFKEGDYRLCVEHHFGYVLEEGDTGESLSNPTLPSEPTVTITPTPTSVPTPTSTPATVTPTTTPSIAPVPTYTPTPTVTPTPTSIPTLTPTPTPTPTPAPIVNNPDLSGLDYAEFNKVYQQDSGKVIASYFVEWGIYGRNYHVQDIPAANLTHLLFGFIAICGDNPHASGGARAAIQRECADKQDYEVTMIDRFANLEKTYPGDTWIDDVSGSNYNGNFGQLKKLKAQYPHLTILPSVGGWTLSTPFYEMAKDPTKRATFVDSVVEFITKYDFFDGVDIDWEYPVYGGTDPGLSSAADNAGYVALMRELREAFDTLSLETGRTYEITSAVGAPPEKIAAVDYATAQQYMDYIFIMTYDFHGAWDATTGHHAALHHYEGNTPGWNGADAAQNMLNAGVPANKVVIGGAFYGRGWRGNQNLNASTSYPLFGEASGAINGTWEAGVLDWRDIYNNFIGPNNTGINGFTVVYDETAQAPYAWNPSSGEFVTYDSPRSLRAKAEYVLEHKLGGMLSWEIDADNGLLLNAINEGLGNSEAQ